MDGREPREHRRDDERDAKLKSRTARVVFILLFELPNATAQKLHRFSDEAHWSSKKSSTFGI